MSILLSTDKPPHQSEHDARKRESNLKLRSRAFAQLKKRIYESTK